MDTDNRHIISGDDEVTLINRVSLPRIPYNNGYGDFCFGRWANRPKTTLKGNVYSHKFWEKGSNGAQLAELNGFVRSGSFEFLKLPHLVSNIIYRLLLDPFYGKNDQDKNRIILYLQKDESPHDSFDLRYHHSYRTSENLWKPWQKQQEFALCKENFEYNKPIHLQRYKPHPSRQGDFELRAYPEKIGNSCIVRPRYSCIIDRNTDWMYLEWIRQATNVSTVFRKGLGDVFWARTTILCDEDYKNGSGFYNRFGPISHGYLSLLCQLRPAICSGSISLGIHVDLIGHDPARKEVEYFPEWCSNLNGLLRFETFTINMRMNECDSSRLPTSFPTLEAARALNVARSFSIKLVLVDMIKPGGHASTQEYRAYRGAKVETMSEALLEMMMPNTLRKIPAKSEMEIYLESRI